MKPVCRNGKWHCSDCGAELDTDFIPPRYCDCGLLIDWTDERDSLDLKTMNARIGLLEVRIVAVIDALKAHGLLE